MSNFPIQKSSEYTVEQEVSYLLDKQEDLRNTLSRYNNHVANFEDKRDRFLEDLLSSNRIKQLREVVQLFDKNAYVELDVPDFVVVDVPDRFKNAVDVNEEYVVVDDKFTKTSKLINEAKERIIQAMTTRDDIFRSLLAGKKEHVVFSSNDKFVILNGKQFMHVNNGNGTPESIVDHADEIFDLIKKHTFSPNVVSDIGMKPFINENTKSIVYVWA